MNEDRTTTAVPPTWEAESFAGPVAADPEQPTVIRIGRAPDNEVVVDDLLTALRHAELRDVGDGTLELVDLGSQNGTFLNGRRIKRVQVENLDVISIGHHLYRLVDGQVQAYVDDGLVVFRAAGLSVRIPGGSTLVDQVSLQPARACAAGSGWPVRSRKVEPAHVARAGGRHVRGSRRVLPYAACA